MAGRVGVMGRMGGADSQSPIADSKTAGERGDYEDEKEDEEEDDGDEEEEEDKETARGSIG